MRVYFILLGVTDLNTKAEVKSAYKKLAQQHHPDKSHDDGEKFKQIKAAYDFIIKNWTKRATFFWTPSPKPSYAAPGIIKLKIDFSQIFGNASIKIPGTNYYVKVPYGAVNGLRERTIGMTLNGVSSESFNVEYELEDPTGFYSTRVIKGVSCLYCQLAVSTGMVQTGFEFYLRNINTTMPDFNVSISTDKLIKVSGVGLPLNLRGSSRGDLYLEPVVSFKNSDQEIFPVLQELYKQTKQLYEFKIKEGERRI